MFILASFRLFGSISKTFPIAIYQFAATKIFLYQTFFKPYIFGSIIRPRPPSPPKKFIYAFEHTPTVIKVHLPQNPFFAKSAYEVTFLYNFTIQYVNKSIVNVKVLTNKDLVIFLALKTAHFLSRNGQETGTRVYCAISSRDVVLWTELFTKKGFWGKTTCRAILNWVISLNLQVITRILMLCIANTRRIDLIVLSSTLRHQDVLATQFKDHFWEQNRTIFRCYKIANFFQTGGSNFGIASLKCWTFKLLKNWIRFICTLNKSLHLFKTHCSFFKLNLDFL